MRTKQPYVKGKLKKTCRECLASFEVFNCESYRVSCSRECSNKAKVGRPGYWTGKKRSLEDRLKIGEGHKRIPAWNKGKPMSTETKRLLSLSRTGKSVGEENKNWKGDGVQYRALHNWIERKCGKPTMCLFCKTDGLTGHSIHWANRSGEYRREVSDWLRLCAKCHGAYDKGKRDNYNTKI